jgi:hypothetical protein
MPSNETTSFALRNAFRMPCNSTLKERAKVRGTPHADPGVAISKSTRGVSGAPTPSL